MITIKFKIDEDIIARRIISKNCMPTSFANYLWEKHNDSYKLLKSNFLSENIDLEIMRIIACFFILFQSTVGNFTESDIVVKTTVT